MQEAKKKTINNSDKKSFSVFKDVIDDIVVLKYHKD